MGKGQKSLAEALRDQSEGIQNQIQVYGRNQESSLAVRNEQSLAIIRNQKRSMVRRYQPLPAQVPLSRPVILLDACGRYVPFHLEFIDSAEVSASILYSSSITYVIPTGLDCRPEGTIQGQRPPQDRKWRVRTAGLETSTRSTIDKTMGNYRQARTAT